MPFRLLLVLTLLFAAPAFAQTVTQPTPTQQIEKLLQQKNSKATVGEAIAMGMLVGCTQKKAGKDATNRFYNEVHQVGKTTETYCKQGNATAARALILATVEKKRTDPVALAALGCYDAQSVSLAGMAGPTIATRAANYAHWFRTPGLAAQQIKESDICR